MSRVNNSEPEPGNMHRKLQRQLTLNPSCDPRLYRLRRYQQPQQRVSQSPQQQQQSSAVASSRSNMQHRPLTRHISNESSYPVTAIRYNLDSNVFPWKSLKNEDYSQIKFGFLPILPTKNNIKYYKSACTFWNLWFQLEPFGSSSSSPARNTHRFRAGLLHGLAATRHRCHAAVTGAEARHFGSSAELVACVVAVNEPAHTLGNAGAGRPTSPALPSRQHFSGRTSASRNGASSPRDRPATDLRRHSGNVSEKLESTNYTLIIRALSKHLTRVIYDYFFSHGCYNNNVAKKYTCGTRNFGN